MYNNNDYDVAIIGGGLAGLSLAIQSAKAGYKTILFEKETYPFHKVCGEYISNESRPFLQRLGIELDALALPQISRLLVSDAGGKAYPFPLASGGFGISRYKLDDLLYKCALQNGVVVSAKTKVTNVTHGNSFIITTTQDQYTAKVVCGAYGKRSNLDVQWKRLFVQQKPNKLNHYIGIKYHVQYPQPADTIALHNFPDGYCGISQIENQICCLCYLTTASNLKRYNGSIHEMEQQLLSTNPLLADIFSRATFLYKQPLTISQISFDKKTQVQNGILMMGDAAGLITPLCGNGMSMALHASLLAFNNVQLFLEGKLTRREMEERYALEWKQQFSRRLLAGRWIQRLFGGKETTAFFLKMMHAVPLLAEKLINATHGTTF